MQVSKDPRECFFCKKTLEHCVDFINEENQSFRLLPPHSSCHMECYFQEIVTGILDSVLGRDW